jgi:tetratricopeptide (TPR) repeat protein
MRRRPTSAGASVNERTLGRHRACKFFMYTGAYDRAGGRQNGAGGAGLAKAHLEVGRLWLERGNLDEAIRCYRAAVAVDSQNIAALTALGLALHHTTAYDEAVQMLRRAVAADGRSFEAHYNLGVVLAEQFDLDGAIDAYRAALALQPQQVMAQINLALLLKEQGRLDDALEWFERAAAGQPDLAPAHLNLAAAWLAKGEPAAAMPALRRALALAPQDAEAHALCAQALLEQGDLAGAEAAARQALAFDPAHMGARAYLGPILQLAGKRADAERLADYPAMLRVHRFTPPARWPDLAAFNAELADTIIHHPTLRSDRPTATRNGGQTLEILGGSDWTIVALTQFFEQAVADYLATALPALQAPVPVPRRWRLAGWAVVLRSSGHQVPHFHPSGVVSGVYYVRVPKSVQAPGSNGAGALRLGVPPENILTLAPGGEDSFLTATVTPEPGKLVLFPAYAWHHTIPFEDAEDRICVAFDVVPVA